MRQASLLPAVRVGAAGRVAVHTAAAAAMAVAAAIPGIGCGVELPGAMQVVAVGAATRTSVRCVRSGRRQSLRRPQPTRPTCASWSR
jgi:hypothetical protein